MSIRYIVMIRAGNQTIVSKTKQPMTDDPGADAEGLKRELCDGDKVKKMIGLIDREKVRKGYLELLEVYEEER